MAGDHYTDDQLGKFQTLVDIVERLRAPGGCPWDREQTHATMKRNLLEECYEVLEAIDQESPQALSEELGDLLAQVAFHGQIAREAGTFDLADVLTHINQKLVRRHPHVFGDVDITDAGWDANGAQLGKAQVSGVLDKAEKKAEGGSDLLFTMVAWWTASPTAGSRPDLPALAYFPDPLDAKEECRTGWPRSASSGTTSADRQPVCEPGPYRSDKFDIGQRKPHISYTN